MSYYYEIEERHRILLVMAYGDIEEDELRELYFDIRKRKDEERSLTGILDLSEVTAFDIRCQVIRELAAHPPNFDDPTLRAVVAPTDHLFAMSRMFQQVGSETRQQLHVVRTLNEALSLLGASDAQFHRLGTAK